MDLVGIEPTTSSMPWKRAPSCATGPLFKAGQLFIFAATERIVKRQLLVAGFQSPVARTLIPFITVAYFPIRFHLVILSIRLAPAS